MVQAAVNYLADLSVKPVTYNPPAGTGVPRRDGNGLPRWQEAIFAKMGRNAARISDYLHLPTDRLVEIGREIEV